MGEEFPSLFTSTPPFHYPANSSAEWQPRWQLLLVRYSVNFFLLYNLHINSEGGASPRTDSDSLIVWNKNQPKKFLSGGET